jgi:hypothetical protein
MIMPMLANLTNIISLRIRDRLIKFEEWSSTKSISVIHILNPVKYSNPFLISRLFHFILSLCGFTHRRKDQEFNKLVN